MVVIEVVAECVRKPIKLLGLFGDDFPGMVRIVVCNDDPPVDTRRYVLQVACRKAHINCVADSHGLQSCTDAESGGETFTEHWQPPCAKSKDCSFGRLTLQELLLPFVTDELSTSESRPQSHWDD